MKKICFVILLLVSCIGQGQTKEIAPNTVSVTGRAIVKRTITRYKAKVSLNMEQVYYSDPQCTSLETFKAKYFAKLDEKGIDSLEFKENKMEFLAYGYQRDGTVLELETTSLDKIKTLSQIKMPGISTTYQFKAEITEADYEKLLKEAFDNAHTNASKIGKVSNKKLGAIVSIVDNTVNQSIWSSRNYNYDEYATIYVTYRLD